MPENARLNASLLVVEDDEDTREMLRFLLEQHAANVVAVGSVEAALDVYRSGPPDILITDIAMAGYNGYALIARVREWDKERNRRTPAIALTAFTSAADRETAFGAGFDAYLEKPFGPAELISTIKSLLGGKSKTA